MYVGTSNPGLDIFIYVRGAYELVPGSADCHGNLSTSVSQQSIVEGTSLVRSSGRCSSEKKADGEYKRHCSVEGGNVMVEVERRKVLAGDRGEEEAAEVTRD